MKKKEVLKTRKIFKKFEIKKKKKNFLGGGGELAL